MAFGTAEEEGRPAVGAITNEGLPEANFYFMIRILQFDNRLLGTSIDRLHGFRIVEFYFFLIGIINYRCYVNANTEDVHVLIKTILWALITGSDGTATVAVSL